MGKAGSPSFSYKKEENQMSQMFIISLDIHERNMI